MASLLFPFKVTTNLDIEQVLRRYVTLNYGGESTYEQVAPAISELSKLRQKLDYNSLVRDLDQKIETADEIEQTIIKYIHIGYLIDKSFTFETNSSNSSTLYLPFPWSDSLNAKKFCDISSMKYELVGHLFNLAVNEYHRGSRMILTGNTERDRKIGVAKLKVGIWALEEVKKLLPQLSLSAAKNQPLDLYMNYINVIAHFCSGLATFANFIILEPNQLALGVINICSLAHSSARHFKLAYEILNNDKVLLQFPPEFKKKLISEAYLFHAVIESVALMKYSQYQVGLIEDDPLGGHMGLALTYALLGDKITSDAKKFEGLKTFHSGMKERLLETSTFFATNLPIYKQKNEVVYKHKVFSAVDAPEIPPLDQKLCVTGAEPSAMSQKLDCEAAFLTFCSPELQAALKEYKEYGFKRAKDMDDSLKTLIEKKNKYYLENYVNYLVDIDLNKAASKELPLALRNRHQDYVKRGGKDQLANLITTLKETSVNCGMMIANIRESLQREKMEDTNMKTIFLGRWNRQPSDILNKDYIKNINDLGEKFNTAQQVDQGIISKYETNLSFVEIFSKPESEILKMLPAGGDNDFVEKNKENLKKLKDYNQYVNNIIESMRENVVNVRAFMSGANFSNDIIYAKEKKLTLQQGIEQALKPVAEIINDFNSKLNDVQEKIKLILEEASKLNASKKADPSGNNKFLDELSSSTNRIMEVFSEVDQGLKFYQNLSLLLIDLDKRTSDFVMAREMEKQNLIQILSNAPAGNNQGGYNNPYGFK